MQPSHSPPRLSTLIVLTAVSVLTLNMFLPSLPTMTRAMDTGAGLMALSVSGYMLVSAVLQIFLGPVSDRLGRRPVMLFGMAVYVLASIGCTLAQDITTFLIFRMAQGVVVVGTVLSSAIIRDQYSAREAAAKMGTIAAAMALAPMLGPMIGGILADTIGWRMIFALYAALGLIALVLVWVDLGETRAITRTPTRKADYAALLRSRLFWAYVLCQAFSVGTFYIFLSGVPFVAAHSYGLSPALIGVGLGAVTAGFMLGATLTSRFAQRLGIGRLILAGRVVSVLAIGLGLGAFLAGATGEILLFGATVFVGIGNGLTISNANAGAMSVRPDLAGTAAGLTGALSISLGAGLTWATGLIVEWSATPSALLAMMLASLLLALLAGVVALRLDTAPR